MIRSPGCVTPADPDVVEQLAAAGTPAQAVVRAWLDPGDGGGRVDATHWHSLCRRTVRLAMPVLAAALDRLAAEDGLY